LCSAPWRQFIFDSSAACGDFFDSAFRLFVLLLGAHY